MEFLGQLDNPRMAQAFVDYLALQDIDVQIKPVGDEQFELYVDAIFLEQARKELAQFAQSPFDKKYLDASWQRNSDDNPLTYHSEGKKPLAAWFSQGGWLTHTVLATCVVVFILAHFTPVYDLLAFPSDGSLKDGQWWRWITPAFMHFSMMHIVFNLLWWWLLGGKMERYFGSVFLLLFTLFSALISNFSQYITHFANNFGGLSGVVYALMGFCWLYGRLKPNPTIELSNALFGFALIWMAMGFVDVLGIPMANQAHLAGLLSGLAFAFIFTRFLSGQAKR